MSFHVSEIIRRHLGWCPQAPTLHTASTVLSTQPVTVNPLEPDGGAGGSGRIGRGTRIAIGSIKTLIRNKQLLWFSFLTGLVMAFMFIIQYGLHLLGTYPYYVIDLPRWLVLTFVIDLVSVFILTVLLAGLVLSISPGECGGPVSFRKGLSRTKGYLRPLTNWSVLIALLGTAIYVPFHYFGYMRFTLYPVLDQFPFNFILFPEVYSTGPIGGTYAILSAVTSIVVVSGINIILLLLTLFVIPLLVLENRRLPEAVAGSATLMKKVRVELSACFLLLILLVSVAAMTSLLFRVVYGVIAPDMLLFWYPGDTWIAAAVLYMLLLCGIIFVISTIAGIAAVNLYTYAKTGRLPGMP
ncbi:MAG: hypothetical protein Q8N94_08650 [Methanoregula sp.]|nr:hypothetical protein [Methanoregula sp.]